MWILTSDEMRAADRATIEGLGVPGPCLMELAGAGAAQCLEQHAGLLPGEPVAVLAGAGNNGGDGHVLARHLANHGYRPTVWLFAPRERVGGDARLQLEVLLRLGLPVREVHEPAALAAAEAEIAGCRVRVDALLGTGLEREVRGPVAAGIALLERSRRTAGAWPGATFTLAIDLPSGLSADTGQPLGQAVHASRTVTFAALKRGHLLHPGPTHCGPLTLIDIGIPPATLAALGPGLRRMEVAEARACLPPRPADSHKGDYGRVLVLAGSPTMAGAGLLAAHGAVRGGAGVVTLATVAEGCAAARARFPSLLSRLLDPTATPDPVPESAGFGAVVCGPGLGLTTEAETLVQAWAAACPLPLVLDADALGLLARLGPVAAKLAAAAGPRLLTPHEGELARLLGRSREEVHRRRVEAVREAADRWGAVVVLKGNGTLVASPDGTAVTIIDRGHPAQATGGSGDVLGGLLAALLGGGLPPRAAAEAAVFLHGLAGERVARQVGPAGITAEELADALPAARAELQHGGER